MSSRRLFMLLGFIPAAANAQFLGRRIDAVRDGNIRFTFSARPDICGDGRETVRFGDSFIAFPSRQAYAHGERENCVAGPVRVAIARSDGQSVSYRVHIGGRWDAGDDAITLGMISAPEAARYLLEAATRAHGENARYALAAAACADSIELAPALADVARDGSVDRDVRQNAVFWIGSYDDDAAGRALHALASDASLDEQVRGAAIIALGRDDPSDDDVAWLRRLYPSLSEKLRSDVFLAVSRSESPRASAWLADVAADDRETEHTREQALFWLGQGRGPTSELVRLYERLEQPALRRQFAFVLSQRRDDQALDKLMDMAQHDRDRDVRRQALFWLGQSQDPRALAFIRDLVTR